MIEGNEQRIGRYAWVMAWVGLVVGQLHALSRFRTEDGKEDLELPLTAAWAEPADKLLSPLLSWADPDVVYVTYGKIWLPVFLAFTLCAVVVYRRRQPLGFEKWAWRLAIGAYGLACVAVGLEYWTQWTGNYEGDGIEATLFTVAFAVIIPGLLGTLVFSTVLGITLLAKRFRPALPAVLLAAMIPLAFGIMSVTSMGSAALPVMFAFGLLGRRIADERGAVVAQRASVRIS
ncbi:MAG TPA: hypothetical protein VFK52_13185 [Nocardioidaceae bacterium]|nr:hypothetical protein [Nocardioidaceae bacterium]